MNILVTGGAGYIGSATVAALLDLGRPVVVYDNLSTGHRSAVPHEAVFHKGDMADGGCLRTVMRQHQVSHVIQFAAHTSVPESLQHPDRYFRNNTVNALVLLDAMRDCGVDRIVFSSTAAVYGEPRNYPIDEQHPTHPTNPYGLSKRFVEQILETYETAYGIRNVSLRYFNAAGGSPARGEDHRPEIHLIPRVLQVALGQHEAIRIFGLDYPTPDGTCVRDYIHVDDLASAHLSALDYLERGGAGARINLGNGQGYSVQEVVAVAREVTGHPIPTVDAPRRPGDPTQLVASSALARQVLGWEPARPQLHDIVTSAWEWHLRHPHGYND